MKPGDARAIDARAGSCQFFTHDHVWARGGEDGAWDLALEPGESWTLARTEAPVLAAALSAEKVAVAPPDRSRVILLGREGRDEVAGFGASEISALAADSEGVWIAAGRSLYRVEEEDLTKTADASASRIPTRSRRPTANGTGSDGPAPRMGCCR